LETPICIEKPSQPCDSQEQKKKNKKQKVRRYVILNPRVLLIVNQEVEIIREKRKKELRKNFTL
jgi:hypothetical protein